MARVEFLPGVLDDFDRVFDHLPQWRVEEASQRIAEILQSLQLLSHSPPIGRKVRGGKRELAIGQSERSDAALYRFVPDVDTAFVLAIRSHCESGYTRKR